MNVRIMFVCTVSANINLTTKKTIWNICRVTYGDILRHMEYTMKVH